MGGGELPQGMGSGELVLRPATAREPAPQGRDGFHAGRARRAGARGRAWSSAAQLLLTRRLPGARPSRPPRGVLLRGPRPLTCPVAAAPPPSSISQPGPQLRPPPGTRPGLRHHRHRRRRLRASREPPSRGRRGAVTETPRAPPPPRDTQAPAPACPPRPQRLAGLRGWPRPPPRPPPPTPRRCPDWARGSAARGPGLGGGRELARRARRGLRAGPQAGNAARPLPKPMAAAGGERGTRGL